MEFQCDLWGFFSIFGFEREYSLIHSQLREAIRAQFLLISFAPNINQVKQRQQKEADTTVTDKIRKYLNIYQEVT